MNQTLTFTRKSGLSWFHYRYGIVVSLLIIFLVGSIYFSVQDGWKAFLSIFPFALVMLPFAIYIHGENRRLSKAVIEVNPNTENIIFRNFRFTSKFLPEAPKEEENLHFTDIIISRFQGTQNGDSLHLETTKGKVVITDEMSGFQNIVELFCTIAEANKEELKENLKKAPSIKTPWYGWLILASAVACAAFSGWYFMYRTN